MELVAYDDGGPPAALGIVLDGDRGALPFELIHGEALVACAAWALGAAGVSQVDLGTTWAELAEREEPVVLHDPLCPMTPADFIAACVVRAVDDDVLVVGVRPVTDTVKHVDDGFVGETVDRDELVAITSPLVLPTSVVAAVAGLPSTDLAAVVALLAERFRVEAVQAPAAGRRVASAADVKVLEALTAR